jgi:hypothetical protein
MTSSLDKKGSSPEQQYLEFNIIWCPELSSRVNSSTIFYSKEACNDICSKVDRRHLINKLKSMKEDMIIDLKLYCVEDKCKCRHSEKYDGSIKENNFISSGDEDREDTCYRKSRDNEFIPLSPYEAEKNFNTQNFPLFYAKVGKDISDDTSNKNFSESGLSENENSRDTKFKQVFELFDKIYCKDEIQNYLSDNDEINVYEADDQSDNSDIVIDTFPCPEKIDKKDSVSKSSKRETIEESFSECGIEQDIKELITDPMKADRYYSLGLKPKCRLCGCIGHNMKQFKCPGIKCYICNGEHKAKNCSLVAGCTKCGDLDHARRQCGYRDDQRSCRRCDKIHMIAKNGQLVVDENSHKHTEDDKTLKYVKMFPNNFHCKFLLADDFMIADDKKSRSGCFQRCLNCFEIGHLNCYDKRKNKIQRLTEDDKIFDDRYKQSLQKPKEKLWQELTNNLFYSSNHHDNELIDHNNQKKNVNFLLANKRRKKKKIQKGEHSAPTDLKISDFNEKKINGNDTEVRIPNLFEDKKFSEFQCKLHKNNSTTIDRYHPDDAQQNSINVGSSHDKNSQRIAHQKRNRTKRDPNHKKESKYRENYFVYVRKEDI